MKHACSVLTLVSTVTIIATDEVSRSEIVCTHLCYAELRLWSSNIFQSKDSIIKGCGKKDHNRC